jgi:hypothetical protein
MNSSIIATAPRSIVDDCRHSLSPKVERESDHALTVCLLKSVNVGVTLFEKAHKCFISCATISLWWNIARQ